MQVVCEATQIKADKRVCVAALQCLVNIMSLYYRFMEPYMSKALFPVIHPYIELHILGQNLTFHAYFISDNL